MENQPITTALQERQLDQESLSRRRGTTFICSLARLTSLPERKWSEKFLEEIRSEAGKDAAYQKAKKEAEPETLTPKDQKAREVERKNGLLYRRKLLWVPNDMVQRVMESEHNTKVAGHMGQDKTIELIRGNFWWPKMNERIIDFVRSCPKCQQNKAKRHPPYGLSSPLELPYAPRQSIAMDFITELPLSEGCDQLWVIID